MSIGEQSVLTSEKVWQDYHDRVTGFVRRRVSDPDSADDIVQDVFLRVHTRLESLQNPEKLESWLFQIARNAVIDHYRQRPTVSLPEIVTVDEQIEKDEPVIRELVPCLKRFMLTLPEEDREALQLTAYEGRLQREVAQHQGLSVSGAKSRIQRARSKLRDLLMACCQPEFDRLGGIMDYTPSCTCDRTAHESQDCCTAACAS